MKTIVHVTIFTVASFLMFTATHAAVENVISDSDINRKQYCLSIDCGGLRGIIPATILASIEKGTGATISELFKSGITGTSTGALIALGLAARKSTDPTHADYNTPLFTAEQLVDFYLEHAGGIFKCWTPANCCHNFPDGSEGKVSCVKQTVWGMLTCFGCFGCCYNCSGMCGPQYSNAYLKKELNDKFGSRKLRDVLVPVQVVAYDTTTISPRYFNTLNSPDVLMVDAALASSAAPTFFSPYRFQVPGDRKVYYRCIDGGIFENSPTSSALRFAVEIYRNNPEQQRQEAEIKDFKVISIGTGDAEVVTNFASLSKAGKLGWASKVVELSMSGTSKATHNKSDTLFGRRDDGKHYYRLGVNIPASLTEMDDPAIVETLHIKSKDIEMDEQFAKLLKELKERKVYIDDAPLVPEIASIFRSLRRGSRAPLMSPRNEVDDTEERS